MATRRPAPVPLTEHGAGLERTALAWERTAISLSAVGILLLKVVTLSEAARVAGVVLLGGAIVIVLLVVPLGYRRALGRVRLADEREVLDPDRWRAVGLVGVSVLVSTTALALAVDLIVVHR